MMPANRELPDCPCREIVTGAIALVGKDRAWQMWNEGTIWKWGCQKHDPTARKKAVQSETVFVSPTEGN